MKAVHRYSQQTRETDRGGGNPRKERGRRLDKGEKKVAISSPRGNPGH